MNTNLGQRFGEGQRGFLAGAEERGFAPGRQMVQAQLALTGNLYINRVHLQAEGAAVQLRYAHVDQVLQRRIDGGFCHLHAQGRQRVGEGGCDFMVVNASAHCLSSFLCGICHAMRQIYAVHDIVKRYKKREMR